MEIPNYDSGEKSNNGFKQLYKYMPKNTFRMLLAGILWIRQNESIESHFTISINLL